MSLQVFSLQEIERRAQHSVKHRQPIDASPFPKGSEAHREFVLAHERLAKEAARSATSFR